MSDCDYCGNEEAIRAAKIEMRELVNSGVSEEEAKVLVRQHYSKLGEHAWWVATYTLFGH